MKRRFLKTLSALFFTMAFVAAATFVTVAASAAAEDFEGYTTATQGAAFRGTGKLFASNSTIPAESLSIKEEMNGTFTNKYLSVTGNAGDGILVGQSGILQYDETLLHVRLKFSPGGSQTVVLRSTAAGAQDLPILKFDGTTKVSLVGNDNCYTSFTDGSWYDLYALINKNEGSVRAELVKEKDHSVLSGQKIFTNYKKYFDDTCSYRIRMVSTNILSIDDISVSDAGEYSGADIAREDFEQFSAGQLTAANFSESGLMILPQYYPCAAVATEQGNKILAITGSEAQKQPFIYNLKMPDGTNILEFDMKMSAGTASARVFLRSSSGSQVILTEYNQNILKIGSKSDSSLTEKIKSEFVHFAFEITEGTSGTTIKSYANGKYYETTNYSTKYNDVRFLVNSSAIPSNYSTSTLYLDNIRVHTVNQNADDMQKAPIYVNTISGNDLNDGRSESNPLKSLNAAYELMDRAEKIIIMNDMTYTAPTAYEGTLVIEGSNASVKLTIPNESISMTGNLTIDKISLILSGTFPKIYANGYALVIGENTSFNKRMEVYGGKLSDHTGDTHITLLGGQYSVVYGGCQTGNLTGNTYVTVGGNANKNDSLNDSSANFYSSYLCGGGNKGYVSGTTNITLKGNAVFAYIVGAGQETTSIISGSNITISGGKAMNVYGGSISAPLTNCNINITMTGGVVEGIFGGCNAVSMTGNVFVTLKAGEVTRRVYTGCYDKGGNNYVNGTTTLVLTPNVLVNTGTGLSTVNRMNSGVFSGSRGASNSAEINTIIFADNCYESFKNQIGDVSGWDTMFTSKEKYIVKAGVGGSVRGAGAGKVAIEPDEGKIAMINGIAYNGKTANINEGVTVITFANK